jgi:hypothetical protein
MVPPSQGWFDVMRDSSGSGDCWVPVAVGELAVRVKERAVGERAKSAGTC